MFKKIDNFMANLNDKLMEKMCNHDMKDAKWYQFWRPSSGLFGGVIFSFVLTVTVGFFIYIIHNFV